MVSTTELKVQDILENVSLIRDQKIAKLKLLEEDARGLQRAGSESAMVDDDGWYADLRIIEKALKKLGQGSRPEGASSL
ncbi:hypothetical protein IFT84_19135 [Rhizobium sp. CFBP 8762]|nr:hypothetical protein [Rhizobium sp. CFBP 8762]